MSLAFAASLLTGVLPALGATSGWAAGRGRPAAVTMQRMADVVNTDTESPALIELAPAIVSDVGEKDFNAQAAAIMRWLRSNTRFVRDPTDTEVLRSPTYMLGLMRKTGKPAAGDCDDIAMLGAAVAKTIGFKAKFVAEAYAGGPLAPLVHVFTIVETPGGWRALDTQRPATAIPLRPVRRVFTDV